MKIIEVRDSYIKLSLVMIKSLQDKIDQLEAQIKKEKIYYQTP